MDGATEDGPLARPASLSGLWLVSWCIRATGDAAVSNQSWKNRRLTSIVLYCSSLSQGLTVHCGGTKRLVSNSVPFCGADTDSDIVEG